MDHEFIHNTVTMQEKKDYFNNGLACVLELPFISYCKSFADCSTSHGYHSMERSCHMLSSVATIKQNRDL